MYVWCRFLLEDRCGAEDMVAFLVEMSGAFWRSEGFLGASELNNISRCDDSQDKNTQSSWGRSLEGRLWILPSKAAVTVGYNFDNMVDWRSLVTSLGHMSTALEILQKADERRKIFMVSWPLCLGHVMVPWYRRKQ